MSDDHVRDVTKSPVNDNIEITLDVELTCPFCKKYERIDYTDEEVRDWDRTPPTTMKKLTEDIAHYMAESSNQGWDWEEGTGYVHSACLPPETEGGPPPHPVLGGLIERARKWEEENDPPKPKAESESD